MKENNIQIIILKKKFTLHSNRIYLHIAEIDGSDCVTSTMWLHLYCGIIIILIS